MAIIFLWATIMWILRGRPKLVPFSPHISVPFDKSKLNFLGNRFIAGIILNHDLQLWTTKRLFYLELLA